LKIHACVEPSPYTPNPVTIIPGPAGILQLSSSTCVEPSSSTPNPVRIIPGPAGVVQRAKLLRENVFILDSDGALMSTQEYMQKVVEDVGEDDDFNSGAWFSATNYVIATGGTVTGCLGDINNFLKKRKLKQVVAIVKSCSSNALGDLNVTMKNLSGTIHHKVIGEEGYAKDITVRVAMILANVSVFTPKPSEHYPFTLTKKIRKCDLNVFRLSMMPDFYSDPYTELISVIAADIDGMITDNPKNASAFMSKESISRPKQYSLVPIPISSRSNRVTALLKLKLRFCHQYLERMQEHAKTLTRVVVVHRILVSVESMLT
ncbi:hypothetical protein Tco_0184040, partial [Tanacetum coccineum]